MDKKQITHLLNIQAASLQGRLVAFVGAGVSVNSSIPNWNKLINELKADLNINYEDDYLRIPQLYKDSRGYKDYIDRVKSILKYNRVIPNTLHKDILSLKPSDIITTNFDDLIEQEINNEQLQYSVIRQDKDLPQKRSQHALIKMHGDFDTGNIVLCEDDYHNYAKNFPLIRASILSLFASKLVLFIGFSFSDPNLKFILNELQRELKDNMQRAYLLSLEKPDELSEIYFQKRGINLVHLEKEDILTIMEGYESSENSHLSLTKEGLYIHQLIECILLVKENPKEDWISQTYRRLMSINDELKAVGLGIKYFIPRTEMKTWNLYSEGLQIDSPYIKRIEQEMTTFKGRKLFLISHPFINIKSLKQLAYNNYIYKIDEIELINDSLIKAKRLQLGSPSIGYLYSLDYNKLEERISFLTRRDLTCNSEDLELPFVLAKLGNYSAAYLRYNEILEISWKKQKFILYFICIYNMWSMRNAIRYLSIFQKDYEFILPKLDKINLSEVLNNLPINRDIRYVLEDLITNKTIGYNTIECEILKESLNRQKESSLKGGCSINSFLPKLMSIFMRQFNFCHANHLIYDNSTHFASICKDTIIGMLNSFTIKDSFNNRHIHNSKISKLNSLAIFIMVHYINNTNLKNILNQYSISEYSIDKKGINNINNYLSNLMSSNKLPFSEIDLFRNKIENLLLVISRSSDDEIDKEAIYSVVIKYWDLLRILISNTTLLPDLVHFHKPSSEQCKKIIDLITKESDLRRRFKECILILANLMNKDNQLYSNTDFDNLMNKDNVCVFYPLYNIMNTNNQKLYKDVIQRNMTSLIDYLEFINNSNEKINCLENFSALVKKEYSSCVKDSENHIICNYLISKLYFSQDADPSLKNIIEGIKDRGLQFFFNPENFPDPSIVKIGWLLILFRDKNLIFDKLLKIDYYRRMIKDWLIDNKIYLNEKEKNRLIELL